MRWMHLLLMCMILCTISCAVMAAPLSDLILHERKSDFQNAILAGIKWENGNFVLDKEGVDKGQGTILSPEIPTKFLFNNVVPSWNCITPVNTGIRVELRAGIEGNWTNWFEISQWGDNIPVTGFGSKKSLTGYVDADTLELYKEYNYIQYRITLIAQEPRKTPKLKRVALVYANRHQRGNVNDHTPSNAWGTILDVPYLSQMVEDPSIANRICAPTSMTMVLNYHNNNLLTHEVAKLAYDPLNRIYGNWSYVAAIASQFGLKSYVTRFPDWRGVEEQIIKGNPVIVSISFRANELQNSPINSSGGHIIVVRGFTEDGQVVCNDSAAYSKIHGQVIYDREQLRRAWNNGVAIITEPEVVSNKTGILVGTAILTLLSLLVWLVVK